MVTSVVSKAKASIRIPYALYCYLYCKATLASELLKWRWYDSVEIRLRLLLVGL